MENKSLLYRLCLMYIYTEMRTLNLNEGQEGPGSGSGAATSWS